MVAKSHLSLSLLAESTHVEKNNKEILLLGTLRAPLFEPTTKRPPMQLCAVIDQSGSMQGDKIALVRQATTFIAEQLNENDSMSVITYENRAHVVVPMTVMSPDNKKMVIQRINEIRANGGTNICLGLIEGLDTLNADVSNDTVTSTLLLTDGQANDGPTTVEGMVQAIPNGYNAPHTFQRPGYGYGNYAPVTLAPEPGEPTVAGAPKDGRTRKVLGTVNTFGFGNDHDATLLTSLAQRLEGAYYHVPGTNDIGPIFANCLGGLATVFAMKVRVRMEGLNGCTVVSTHTRYTERKDPNGAHTELDIPDVQSQERKDVVLRLRLPDTDKDGAVPCLRMKVTYLNALTGQEETVTQDISVTRCDNPPSQPIPHELDVEKNRVRAAEALSNAIGLGDNGQMEEAIKHITEAIRDISVSPTALEPVNQGLLKDLARATEGLRSQQEYRRGGQQLLNTHCNSHWGQRQTSVSSAGQTRYDTVGRTAMMSNFTSYSS